MKQQKRQALEGALCCLPAAAGVGALYLAPFALALARSLSRGMGGGFVGLENYRELLTNRAFLLAAGNTLLFWALALPLSAALGLCLALVWQKGSGRPAACGFFPAMVPAACSVAALKALFPGLAFEGAGGVGALVALFLWKNTGCCALLLSAALRAIPAELTDTAADLGAGPWACFWRIRLPLLRPAFGGCLLVSLLGSFRVFREAFLLGGAHPDNALYGLQHFLYNNFANMNYPRLAAASVLLILITAGPGLGVLAALRRSLGGRKP